MYNDMYPALCYLTECLSALKIMLAYSSYPIPKPLETTDLFIVSIVLPFPEWQVTGIKIIQAFQIGFLHLLIHI